MGDPAGIGPEIILKAWLERKTRRIAPFCVIGDAQLFEERSRALSLAAPVCAVRSLGEASARFPETLPVLPVPLPEKANPGVPSSANAAAVIASIDLAVDAVKAGEASAIVTAPIAKSVLYAAGFRHPGHTEYLAFRAKELWPDESCVPVMMLVCKDLRVVPLTIHVPLKKVPALITSQGIRDVVRIAHAALSAEFGIDAPRIAICGLNPHAGEGGTIGREETDLILPAIRDLQHEGFVLSGPHAADTLFHAAARRNYDAAICMYHDQALIPIKTLAFDEGVNVTLGLPFIRTSPDHGTAFSIAAKGNANPTSFIEAVRLAETLAARRNARA